MSLVGMVTCHLVACILLLVPRLTGQSRISLTALADTVKPPIPESISGHTSVGASSGAGADDDDGAEDPEVTPHLFQGDMAFTDEAYDHWRVGLRWDVFPEKLWPNRTVPYVISPLYDPDSYITIYKAIVTISYMTCIKFVPWNEKSNNSKDFILIWPIKYPKGCWSYVGKYGGAQILSLQAPDETGPNCLGSEGRAVHELLHALGLFHEQSRADRDKFVTVHYDNVVKGFKANFEKQTLANTTYKFEYDYDSIMHYGRFFFSKGKGKPTITPKYPGAKLGQRKMMSKTDCLKINQLYGCMDESKSKQRKYYTLCNFLGL